ncbi:MAG: hypothetical protein KJ556_17845 [Gammaproteobacteria bacterium]|nr:hypothetical protein [Gammaproteobacteria bacterium]MBU2058202.1 hypothetical protein [Gammaproteobacteria bacterium]MBU2176967.1 hypothetical protein [Gammaproteobacteria bacterium]MBU2246580.1 hypothetical protein [Gammaproteobacteria bacterium]MBU2344959.1 hypothetical protein [Gammaproteobacteria bacterium]
MNDKFCEFLNLLKIDSLEFFIRSCILFFSVSLFLLSFSCLWLLGLSQLALITLMLFILLFLIFLYFWIKKKLMSPYFRIMEAIEAIKVDDYSVTFFPGYKYGIIEKIFSEINEYSTEFRNKKRRFDEKNLLVHSLIKQLDSPVLLLDAERRFIHGNAALSRWLGKDWRMIRLAPIGHLGLSKHKNYWLFDNDSTNNKYKIRSSFYKDSVGEYQLLIFTDISRELRDMQTKSWQEVVRVLSHEIKNSLTPIVALSQELANVCVDPLQKEMLNVISARGRSLSKFISQYSTLGYVYEISKSPFNVKDVLLSMSGLYPDVAFNFDIQNEILNADPVLIEQVLLNLINNAQQSIIKRGGLEKVINVSCYALARRIHLDITDNGIGIENVNNIFVPFYTTTPGGQGIGLTICRNIIEQHGGELTLTNNNIDTGAIASIQLPM